MSKTDEFPFRLHIPQTTEGKPAQSARLFDLPEHWLDDRAPHGVEFSRDSGFTSANAVGRPTGVNFGNQTSSGNPGFEYLYSYSLAGRVNYETTKISNIDRETGTA